MTFLNLSLLAGLGLIALPIVLHFLMRREPKHLEFPALRFIRSRQVANSQRLQLRHWLLLAARMALLLLAALALARPSVASAALGGWLLAGSWTLAGLFLAVLMLVAWSRQMGRVWVLVPLVATLCCLGLGGGYAYSAWQGGGVLLAREETPVAAAVIIDTAPHMQYRHENRTRLEVARELAERILAELPRDSQVAVLDASRRSAAFAVDAAAARRAVERLRIAPVYDPLPAVLLRARTLLEQSDLPRRELYVVSDLSTAAWSPEPDDTWQQQWPAEPPLPVYVLDVGVEDPQNVALGALELTAESLPGGAELAVATTVTLPAASGERAVNLLLEEQDPSLPVVREGSLQLPASVNRGNITVAGGNAEPQPVRFVLRGLAPGVHHGVVELSGEDGLALDDRRYFTFEVETPRPLLCVGGPGVAIRDFAEAIAPQDLRDRQEARFVCSIASEAELAVADLSRYQVVALLDPSAASLPAWPALANFVREGGGVAIFLGANARPVEPFRDLVQRELLGARIGGVLESPVRSPGVYVEPTSWQHPVLQIFRGSESSLPWDRFPIHYYWPLDQLSGDTRPVIPLSDGRPLLVENALGRGRVLLFTTPGCEPLSPGGRTAWNELWAGEDAWPWFVLLNESFRYLARLGEGKLNYTTGDVVSLQNDTERHPPRYALFSPQSDIADVVADGDSLLIRGNNAPGIWRLRGQRAGPVVRGFSSNLAPAATALTRVEPKALADWFGEQGFQCAQSREALRRVVGEQRVGRELYPYLLMLLVFMLAVEHLLANRFYRSESTAESPSSSSREAWWESKLSAWLAWWKRSTVRG
jgi:hypothetical protein